MANGNTYLKETVKRLNVNASALSKRAGWTANMVWQLSNGVRSITPEQAVSLEIASNGFIKAEKACPEFFNRLKALGFERKQGDKQEMESPHGTERREHTPEGAIQYEHLTGDSPAA